MQIRTIAVIGAGALGQGIARAAALAGYATVLEDVLPEMRERAVLLVRQALEESVRRGEISQDDKDNALARLTTAATVEDACRVADLLIEALPEELELKLEIFTIFDKFAKPDAILASATSTISIADLAEMTYRKENCLGMRFVAPVAEMKQLEIVRTVDTSDATIEAAAQAGRSMRKEIVIVSESRASSTNPHSH
jgi:3-hydroxybutyryl-CoA dehydrogenase